MSGDLFYKQQMKKGRQKKRKKKVRDSGIEKGGKNDYDDITKSKQGKVKY